MDKVLIAMSGGVDSSVAAYLVKESGCECAGSTMLLCDGTLLNQTENASDGAADAENIARRLDIPFYPLDCVSEFRENVVAPFIRCYEQGGTPNPCIECNRYLKFGVFLKQAIAMGYDSIATGHYARIARNNAGRYLLLRPADRTKDQTYFLSWLTQEQLAHTRFPLGDHSKEQVRQIAQEQGFINAHKRDSQDICFIPDGDYLAFMERYTGKHYQTGNFLDQSGNIVGQHNGAVGYTLGQRRGLGLAMGAPVYVCGKDMKNNTVTVGTNADLFRKILRANDWNWIAFNELDHPIRVCAKVRYRHIEQPATVYPEADGYARIEFDEPQRAITTGQAVVLYDGDIVIGGGKITEVL